MARTAIIGMGRMGRRHLQVALGMPLEVVGIADQSAAALRSVREEYGLLAAATFTDVDQMLRQTRPELVIVATHAPSHAEYVCQSAELGSRLILCEKPMAVSLAQCDAMLMACRKHGARLAVNHQMRFMEQYTEPKRIVNSAEFGGLSSVTVVAGNFGMAMNGTHYFEMFRYLTEEAPQEVQAWFSPVNLTNPRGPQFEDRAGSVRLTTATGKRFYMEIGNDQGHGMQVTYAGPYGRLTVDELAGTMHLTVRQAEHRTQPTTRYGMPWAETTRTIQPADAVAPTRAVVTELLNGAGYPSGEDGRLAVETLIASYVSNENDNKSVSRISTLAHADRVFPWA